MTGHSLDIADGSSLTIEAKMEICDAHPSCADALQGQIWLCGGSLPNARSATIHWRTWRVIHLHRNNELSRRFVAIADQVLAFRAALPREKHIWIHDSPSQVPRHWHWAYPEIAALVSASSAASEME